MSTLYWYGGSGNFSDYINHWSNNSGNVPASPASGVPTSADDVIFDSLSHTADYTVTINATANCRDMTWANPSSGKPTLAGSSALNIYGSLSLVASIGRTYSGAITFLATTTGKTITSNAVALNSAIVFDGVGGGWQLQDNLDVGTGKNVTLTRGTLDLNGKTVNCAGFLSSNSNTRTLVCTGASIVCNSQFSVYNHTNLGVTGGDSCNITVRNGFIGGNYTWGDVVFNAYSSNAIDTDSAGNSMTLKSLTITNTAAAIGMIMQINQSFVVTNQFSAQGNAQNRRLLIRGSSGDYVRTITAGSVDLDNVDFESIIGAGAATWAGTSIGDAGGNSNISFDSPVERHWVGNGGNMYDTAHWSATKGGAGGATFPLPQDTAYFDESSFSLGSQTVVAGCGVMFKVIDWSAVTNTPKWTLSPPSGVTACIAWGNVIFGTMTFDSTIRQLVINNHEDATITSNGNVISLSFLLQSRESATIYLGDDLNTGQQIQVSGGIFDDGGYDITALQFQVVAGTVNVNGNHEITGTTAALRTDSACTFNAGNSVFTLTDSSSTAKQIIGNSKIFNIIKLSGSGSGSFNFTTNITMKDLITENPVKTITVTAGRTISLISGGSLQGSGVVDNLNIFQSSSTGNKWYISMPDGVVAVNYVSLRDSTAQGGATFYAGLNSSDVDNNDGWLFENPPSLNVISGLFGINF